MSDNRKKDWPARTFRIPPETLDRLNEYAKKTGITRTFIVWKALEKYLNEHESTTHHLSER